MLSKLSCSHKRFDGHTLGLVCFSTILIQEQLLNQINNPSSKTSSTPASRGLNTPTQPCGARRHPLLALGHSSTSLAARRADAAPPAASRCFEQVVGASTEQCTQGGIGGPGPRVTSWQGGDLMILSVKKSRKSWKSNK